MGAERNLYAARRSALQVKAVTMAAKAKRYEQNLARLNREMKSGALLRRVEKKVNASGIMSRILRQRFIAKRTHGMAGGEKWSPLAKSTIARRKAKGVAGTSGALLVRTGRLEKRAERVVRDTFSCEKKIRWEERLADISLAYAEVHQYGGGNNIPARPYLDDPTDAELEPAYNLAQTYLDKEIDRILGSGL